ncbi:MAG: flavin reductase [Eubacterium sp.]|nr:flavin reductase [Candidatus Colimonas fimequi]
MSRINLGPQSLIYPEPVLMVAAYDEDGTPDIMNAAWGGVSGANQITMCLSPGHKTVKNILIHKAFTVSFATADTVVESDYVGIVSANDVPDKFARAGFTATKSETVDAPLVDQYPVALECQLKSYDEDTHIMIGDIKNVAVAEGYLTEAGTIDVAKLQPIAYDGNNHNYNVLGPVVGKAFSDGAKLK